MLHIVIQQRIAQGQFKSALGADLFEKIAGDQAAGQIFRKIGVDRVPNGDLKALFAFGADDRLLTGN